MSRTVFTFYLFISVSTCFLVNSSACELFQFRGEKASRIDAVETFIRSVHFQEGTQIPGEYENRIKGSFTFVNQDGKTITVRFVSTLHRTPCPQCYDGGEVEFLRSGIPDRRTTVLIEQGSSDTINTLGPYLQNLSKRGAYSGEIPQMPKPFSGELREIANEFISKGHIVKNADLEKNPQMLHYAFAQVGTTDALKLMVHLFRSYKIFDKSIYRPIFEAIARDQGILDRFDSQEIDQVFQEYSAKLGENDVFQYDERLRLLHNHKRDLFMAKTVFESDGPVVLVAHTAHILGVMRILASNITTVHSEEMQHVPDTKILRKAEEEGRLDHYLGRFKILNTDFSTPPEL